MLNDTILTTAWLMQEDRYRRVTEELLIAEVVEAAGTPSMRVRLGALLVNIGGRLMTAEQMAPPWRTVQISR